jgi:hypothetical protein
LLCRKNSLTAALGRLTIKKQTFLTKCTVNYIRLYAINSHRINKQRLLKFLYYSILQNRKHINSVYACYYLPEEKNPIKKEKNKNVKPD